MGSMAILSCIIDTEFGEHCLIPVAQAGAVIWRQLDQHDYL